MIPREQVLTKAHEEFAKDLRRYSLARVHNYAIAEDMVADTFLRAWIYLSRGGQVTLMKAFLYHILNCLIVDQYRKRKTTSLDFLSENGFEPSYDDIHRLLDYLDGCAARRLLPRLPAKYHVVLSLRYENNLSIKEIAERTHQSDNTVVVQIHRGLKKLKNLYETVRAV